MKRVVTLLAGLAVFAVLAGCGSNALTLCVEAAKASCQIQYRCCTAAERDSQFGGENLFIGPYADEGGCVDANTRQCQALTEGLDEEINAKRFVFDNDKAN